MFKRPESSYNLSEQAITNILNDIANPLKQIVDYIPENAKVFDIGAGNGLLSQLFTAANKFVIIDGLEPNEYASKLAVKHYRKFFTGYISSFASEIKKESYDYIIFADVIEHVIDPCEFIDEIKQLIQPKTKIIFSIPNVAYGSIRINLLFGKFNYVNSGILEKTHLRFFTYETICNLINTSDLYAEKIYFLHRNMLEIEKSQFLNKISFSSFCEISSDKLSHVYQFLIVANSSKTTQLEILEINQQRYNCNFSLIKYKIIQAIKKIIRLKHV